MNLQNIQAALDQIIEALTDIQTEKNIRETSPIDDSGLKPIINKVNAVAEFFKAQALPILQENVPVGIITADPKLKILSVNSTLSKLLGYSDSELLKMTLMDPLAESDVQIHH